jgi:predicted DNA-binding transcriptional regulator AlpA
MEMSRIVIAGLANIAGELGCSKKTLYKWIRSKGFPAFKLDGIWRVMPRDAEEWLSLQRATVCDQAWH